MLQTLLDRNANKRNPEQMRETRPKSPGLIGHKFTEEPHVVQPAKLQIRVKKNRLSIALKMRFAEFVQLRLPDAPSTPSSPHVPGLAPDQPMSLPPDSALSP